MNLIRPFIEEEYTLRLWDLQTGKQTSIFDVPPEQEGLGVVWAVLSPDGHTALTGATDNLLRLWDMQTGEEIRRMEGDAIVAEGIAFSPNGSQILTSSFYEPTIILWDLESGEIIYRFNAETGTRSVAISSDGRTALTGHMDGSLILWDLESGEQVRRFLGHSEVVTGIDFTPDGQYAVSCAYDNTLIMWNVSTGQEILRYTTPTDTWVYEIMVTPDGHQALAGYADGSLILWDLESGEVVRRFFGHDGGIWGIDISPDGSTAVTGGEDFTIIQWQLVDPSLEELLDWIDTNRYMRELTCDERDLYRIGSCEQ